MQTDGLEFGQLFCSIRLLDSIAYRSPVCTTHPPLYGSCAGPESR